MKPGDYVLSIGDITYRWSSLIYLTEPLPSNSICRVKKVKRGYFVSTDGIEYLCEDFKVVKLTRLENITYNVDIP